ncbi:MAG: DUF998 domain-containing protein [Sporichthyaceae bacterium]|nr:DUF998 domain-containing protein [Sporichthyaceae bacterium]
MSNYTTTTTATGSICDPQTRVTKTLLAYGAIAGPTYLVVSLVQALTRDGFDLGTHPWSLLSNGSLGWIQITNFVLAGLMTIAFAVGLRRVLVGGPAATWAPRLVGAFGVSLIGAGGFVADPAQGFPPGTAADAAEVSWHGMAHFLCGVVGFSCLVVACFLLARRLGTDGRADWARAARVAGGVLAVGFVAVAAGGGAAWANLSFVAAVICTWVFVSALAVHLYRRTARV